MPYATTPDGVKLYYEETEQGTPILFVHEFASDHRGWEPQMREFGKRYRCIAYSARGYTPSDVPADKDAYSYRDVMRDCVAVLDHLKIERADVMGYSMGARITAFLTVNHPERVRSAIIGGLGIKLVEGHGGVMAGVIVAALEAPSLADVTDPTGRAFRSFAEQTRSDLKALAACMASPREKLSREQVAAIKVPILVAVGSRDDVAGSAEELAALIPGAQVLAIPDRDHMLAVGDRVDKAGVVDFLHQRP